jgi:nucleoside-diphosphate-sugar epimerase
VDDIVAGVFAALDYDFSSAPGVPFEICNLGNSQPVKLSDLVSMLEHATGKNQMSSGKPRNRATYP